MQLSNGIYQTMALVFLAVLFAACVGQIRAADCKWNAFKFKYQILKLFQNLKKNLIS